MATVTVGCTIAGGLILRADPYPNPVTINGTQGDRQGGAPPSQVALTTIDAGFWAAWLHQNGASDMVKNGAIFATA